MSEATPAKDFDCVQFMREARDRITAQTASMTIEERVRWFNSRQHDDPTLAKLAKRAYAEACGRGDVQPGRMFMFETGALTNPRYIVNFPTKRHWRNSSRIEDIDSGLKYLTSVIRDRGIRSIAVPPLGSGLGGLEWNDVRSRIEQALNGFDQADIIVFEPHRR